MKASSRPRKFSKFSEQILTASSLISQFAGAKTEMDAVKYHVESSS